MSQTAERLLNFEEFTQLTGEGRYELVNGRLEELVSPRPRHGWTGGRIFSLLDDYLSEHEPSAFWGIELDVPTLPFYGRRPDFAYFSPADAATHVDLDQNRITGIPTLVVEVLSEDDEDRDLKTKRREYAEAGIRHYWILDPQRKVALVLVLVAGAYEVYAQSSGTGSLSSPLFPGLHLPLSRLFR